MTILSFFVTMVSSTPAFAAITCAAGTISGGIENSSVSMVLPDGAASSSSLNCNGFEIRIDSDLTGRRYKLALRITDPAGATVETTTKTELQVVDRNGDGAFVHCSAH